jgi:hypothetical protein
LFHPTSRITAIIRRLQPDGKDQGIDFSAVKHLNSLTGYIPQMKVPGFAYPLLACDLRDVDDDLVGWKDQFHGYEPHNLVHDAYAIIGGEPLKPCFSIVKYWAPCVATLSGAEDTDSD